MSWAILIFTIASAGVPVVTQVGTYSSLNVCEVERVEVNKRLVAPLTTANGPAIATRTICIRKT